MSKIIEKLAAAWGISYEDAESGVSALDAKRWGSGEGLSAIKYAGVIDNGDSNMLAGHNGFWIASAEGNVAYVTNGDPFWDNWSEEVADVIGREWCPFVEAMEGSEI